MQDVRSITSRAIFDALALRGLEDGGGFVRTTPPELYMDDERLRLARQVLQHLPSSSTSPEIGKLVDQLLPVVVEAIKARGTSPPAEHPPMLRT